jgi:pilus assembly protein Flp/PilA
MTNFFKRFAQDESGATAIEYGLIAALISITIIAAATQIGGSVRRSSKASRNAVK